MPAITTRDNNTIFYKDWGRGQPVVFSHGWPLNADAWDEQLMLAANNGFRAIAHDRRGHGRSSQPYQGNDMNTYADDLAELIETLDLHDVILVGHSTGGGEITRYAGRHGTARLARMVLIGAITPLMLKTAANPGGVPKQAFDDIRAGVSGDRAEFYRQLSIPFYSYNREGATVSEGVRNAFWLWSMQCGIRGAYECIAVFSETDLTEDLKKIDVPTLFIHAVDDQIVPIDNAARKAVKLVKQGVLKEYPGSSHGLMVTDQARFHADLLEFLKAEVGAAAVS
jgi:non-heme chloroperoxidase